MNKRVLFLFIGIFIIFSLNPLLAEECKLRPVLIYQDPYPAQPGDFVDIVFQLSGVDNFNCNGAVFELIPEHPFSLDPSSEARRELYGSTFFKDSKNIWNIPYKLRVDKTAFEGEHSVTIRYSPGRASQGVYTTQKFDIPVEDLRVDFEVSIRSYDIGTKELSLEILNIGKHDVEALTIEIPSQDNIEIIGSPRRVVGYLDSSEDTRFSFNSVPKEGEIELKIIYTDQINQRHTLEKIIYYNPSLFEKNQETGDKMSVWFYLFIALLVLFVFRWYWNKRKQKKRK